MNAGNEAPMGCGYPGKDYDGPCRETAKTRLERLIAERRRELTGLESLLKIADKLENGSPVEEALWEMVCRYNHPRM